MPNAIIPHNSENRRPTAQWLRRFGLAAGFSTFYALFAWSTSAIGPDSTAGMVVAASALGALLVAASVVDVETFRLPDSLTLSLFAVGLVFASASGPYAVLHGVLSAAAGFVVFLALAEGYRVLRGRDGLGLGDVKLMGAAGSLVGVEGLAPLLLVAALAALAAVGVVALVKGRPEDGERIPFGPFLALGLWTVWLHGPDFALSYLPG